MEQTSVLRTGKYISVIVMLLTGITTMILTIKGYLDTQTWGEIVLAIGVFLVAVRNYLKDHYGMM